MSTGTPEMGVPSTTTVMLQVAPGLAGTFWTGGEVVATGFSVGVIGLFVDGFGVAGFLEESVTSSKVKSVVCP